MKNGTTRKTRPDMGKQPFRPALTNSLYRFFPGNGTGFFVAKPGESTPKTTMYRVYRIFFGSMRVRACVRMYVEKYEFGGTNGTTQYSRADIA
ncbi:hypothetical protein [Arthrobacter sp. AD-310]